MPLLMLYFASRMGREVIENERQATIAAAELAWFHGLHGRKR